MGTDEVGSMGWEIEYMIMYLIAAVLLCLALGDYS